jgi:predicted porin
LAAHAAGINTQESFTCKKKIIALALMSAFVAPAAFADTDKDELEKLRVLVQELDQKIRALEHKLEQKSAAVTPARASTAAKTPPSVATTTDVTLYGRVNMDFESVKNDRVPAVTTANSANRVQSNASRIGVKGSKALGGDLSAIWQLEVQIDPANGGGTPFNGTRNSNIGLKSNFGTVFAGNWDTPYKVAHNKIELFDNAAIFSATNLIGRSGANNAGNTAVTAVNNNTRQSSVLQYWTPNLNGFQGKIAFSPDSGQTTTTNKTKLSLSGTYENDMLYGALAYESRPDQTTASMTDNATRLVGAYKFDDGLVGLAYEHLSVGTAVATSESQGNWELAGQYKFGSSNLGAFYVRNGNLGARPNTGADMYTLRYGYNFAKYIELYGAYTRLGNDASANYSTLTATAIGTVGAATTNGSTQTGLGMGMIYSF